MLTGSRILLVIYSEANYRLCRPLAMNHLKEHKFEEKTPLMEVFTLT